MLTDRQLMILQVIIDDFIRSAQPVGSRTLSKKNEIALSSATIRNVMADLEEMGFIEKTHTSSGRVPSEKGYRYYVDHLLSPQQLELQDISQIHSIFAERIYELEKLVQKSAQILSEMTKYTAILLGPAVKETKLKRLQIIPLNEETAVAVIITDTGYVENRMFTLPSGVQASQLEKIVNIFNDRLANVPITKLKSKIEIEVADILKKHIDNYESVLYMVLNMLTMSDHEKIFFGGKSNILNQPEFHDLNKVRSLLDMIEREESFYDLFKGVPKGVHVKIGKENQVSEMENCSLITATYSIGQESVGTIAILGPTRMEYSRVISIVDILSHDMSIALTKLYHG
ncbi:heat-inducible transcriptional repressor HrcA [Heyndrickxia ginsengihumi]|uniref:heat-inducible transcriptional repressor HrcA n=1 Tax=Heyndrickxia ginsengihumi TaxID=363870 RepID=UPI000472DFD8|nr:heat-inducible transcriptional repressor HrcA [Heyndrickxia ginsengihumi]MBE6183977.1 heat-inducible transcriptional repressor HrcA [Bacillus sp. (in: firmicutes)]MCM3021783.1 heat-inducible transcriptional repressor HrcA [Heyndrickxia ginsengihumi]